MELVINGEKIDKSLVDQEKNLSKSREPGLSEKKAFERARDRIVRQTLLKQDAAAGISDVTSADVDQEFNKLMADHGGAKFFYRRYNLTKKDDPMIRRDLETQLRTERLIMKITGKITNPTEDELRANYDADPFKYSDEEMVKASHIVLQPDPKAPDEPFRQLVEARKEILGGVEFAVAANKYSSCNDQGGDLGFFPRGKMVEEFETVVFSMESGEVSPVFKTQFGYHLAKVFDRKPKRQLSFEEARKAIFQSVFEEKREAEIQAWVKKKKAKANIVIND
ncbi:MAG: hypothetical protein CMN78_01920 [Spirochaetales bacterium]|nr:hypothetical protein [Spirochaetales bacterium]